MKASLLVVAIVFTLTMAAPAEARYRILFIDSYHKGFAWSDGLAQGVREAIKGKKVTLSIHRMDTKRNKSAEFKKQAALKAKKVIAGFNPDIVVAADDNASKYLIMPYYKDAQLPFIFCGVNYEGEKYGYPYSNVTGMVEIAPIPKLIYSLKHFCRIVKVGFLAADSLTSHKNGSFYRIDIREQFIQRYVKTYAEWKKEFIRLQDEVDVMIIGNPASIEGWDKEAARRFAESNTRIPTGCVNDWIAHYSFMGYTKVAEEQGRYATQTALKVLEGTPISSIPIVRNTEGNLIINMRIAKSLGVKVPKSFIKIASRIIE